MRSSVEKRIKITKTGKVLRRPMGFDHFRTKKTGKAIRHKRRLISLNYPLKKILSN